MKISVRGPIISSDEQWIYDWFGIEATSPKKVNDLLSANEQEDVIVEINSGGGSVYDASEIYALLKGHPGHVTARILGIAASAASFLAMGADKTVMAPTGQMMVHNASIRAEGDYREMDSTSNFLKNVNQTIANAYHLKSGKAYEELLSMMDAETWLTPQQALEHKFIDEIMFENPPMQIVASSDSGMIPRAIIDKMRNEMNSTDLVNQAPPKQTVATTSSSEVPLKEDEGVMNLEELKNKHPELYNQIKQEGYEEGMTAENSRIKSIEDLQLPGNEELINDAKFESKSSASELAVKIVMAEKQRGLNFLQNRNDEAAHLNNFQGGDAPIPKSEGKGNESDMILNAFSRKGGAK